MLKYQKPKGLATVNLGARFAIAKEIRHYLPFIISTIVSAFLTLVLWELAHPRVEVQEVIKYLNG